MLVTEIFVLVRNIKVNKAPNGVGYLCYRGGCNRRIPQPLDR